MDWFGIFLIIVVISWTISEICDSYFNYKLKSEEKEKKDE